MLRFALANLVSRPLRSLLSIIGLAIAIAGMVGLFSISQGLDKLVGGALEQFPGLAVLQRGSPMPLFSVLPADWAGEMAEVDDVSLVVPEIWTRANEINGRRLLERPRLLLGSDVERRLQLRIEPLRDGLVEGRYLSPSDSAACYIAEGIAEEFEAPVGATLTVNGQPLEVVGIYNTGQPLFDVTILTDEETLRRMSRFDAGTVSDFIVEIAEGADETVVETAIEEAFVGRTLQRTLVAPGLRSEGFAGLLQYVLAWLTYEPPSEAEQAAAAELSPLEVSTTQDLAKRFDDALGDVDVMLSLLSAVGVAIAVVSVLNTMGMSVSERTTEFGVLRANGWSRGQIVRLVAFESATIGLIGGLVGAGVGWAATLLVNHLLPDRAHLYASPGLLVFAVVFSTALGLLGGLYPASVAARLRPIDAIRRVA